jgi:hypothetical protein
MVTLIEDLSSVYFVRGARQEDKHDRGEAKPMP